MSGEWSLWNLMRGLSASGACAARTGPAAHAAGGVPAASPIDITGTVERTIYTYRGAPLASVATGQSVTMEVVPYDMAMTSSLTGTSTDTRDDGVAVAYGGAPVGIIFGGSALRMKELAASVGGVSFRAEKVGMYGPGTPEMRAFTLSYRELGELLA